MPCFESKVNNIPFIHMFMVLNVKLSYDFCKHILGAFYYFSHHCRSAFFFCTLTSLNSISEPNNQMCVLGAIYERYEALCSVHMYVCMCLKISINYDQTVRVVVFFHKTECLNMGLKILNLEGQENTYGHCIVFRNTY